MKHSSEPGNPEPINTGYCCVRKNMQIVKHTQINAILQYVFAQLKIPTTTTTTKNVISFHTLEAQVITPAWFICPHKKLSTHTLNLHLICGQGFQWDYGILNP